MTYFGYQALNMALVFSAFASLLFFLDGKNPFSQTVKSAKRAVVVYFGLLTFASVALLYALFTRDFSIEYVAQYSNRSLSWFYTFAAFWAGQAGSLLLWAWLLGVFAVVLLWQYRRRRQELLPYTLGVISFTTFFFVLLLVFKSNPFAKLPFTPPDGNGLNPLLQNPAMIFHPPSLYVGFVGYTVPFAFAIAALLIKKLESGWLKSIRRWSLFSWVFLTIGNILGMQWAYVELGWGGYWAWDPVENSSLLPWLTGTAFLHSIVVQERKGMLKTWNLVLIALTFALTIFGTFVTRSGLISSVHAFGVSDLGPLFLAFLALILIVSTVLILSRKAELKSSRQLYTWMSKESSFILNNMLFSAITLGVFIGTIMPTLTEVLSGQQSTVNELYFNRIAAVVGSAIFLLIGICTVLSWGKTSPRRILKNSWIPATITLVVVAILVLLGIRHVKALLALGIGLFGLGVTLADFIKSGRARAQNQNVSFWGAMVQLFNKHKRRYGGYIVHVGVLLFFIGIIGSSTFVRETTKTVRPGDRIAVGNYQLQFNGLETESTDVMRIDTAELALYLNEKKIDTIHAEKHVHVNFQPATEVGIHSNLKEDVYVILAEYDLDEQLATFSVLVNPLVIWIWIGGVIMVIGTLVAILPPFISPVPRAEKPETV